MAWPDDIDVKDAAGVTRAGMPAPNTNGRKAAANSRPVAVDNETKAALGAPGDPAYTGSGDMSLAAGIKAMATNMLSSAPVPVANEQASWTYIAASSTDTSAGNAADLLDSLLVIPANKSPGAVSFEDGAGANYTLFAGGTDSVTTLIPFPIDMRNIAAGSVWEITTGANVAVIAFFRPR